MSLSKYKMRSLADKHAEQEVEVPKAEVKKEVKKSKKKK